MTTQRTIVKRAAVPTAPSRWRTFRAPPLAYLALVLTLFFGLIGAAQAAGWWSTSGRASVDGTPVEVTGADPAEIKGWMTIGDVLSAYDVPRVELYARFGIPDDVPETAELKSLEDVAPDFSVTELRAWLTARSAAP